MKKIIKSILIFATIAFGLTLFSCSKDNMSTPNTSERNALNQLHDNSSNVDSIPYIEPDYEENGKAVYEYLLNHMYTSSPEVLYLPQSYQETFVNKFDSLWGYYSDFTTESMLQDMASKEMISTELANYRITIYQDLENEPDPESYISQVFTDIDGYNLSTLEKITLKSEITNYKYLIMFLAYIPTDTSAINGSDIKIRESECKIDWDKVLKYAKNGAWIGGVIGAGLGAAAGNLLTVSAGGAIGALMGAQHGALLGFKVAIVDQEFCKKCIPLGLRGRKFSGYCDDCADYLAKENEETNSINWSNLNADPPSAVTVPGQWLTLCQLDICCNIKSFVTGDCLNEGTPVVSPPVKIVDENIHLEQAKVPAGSFYAYGIEIFDDFPKPNEDMYSSYTHTETETYDLSGLVFQRPELTLSLAPASTFSNVKNASLDLANKTITVTWKVDEDHWTEFYNNKRTGGNVKVLVLNNCDGGEEKTYGINATLTYQRQER